MENGKNLHYGGGAREKLLVFVNNVSILEFESIYCIL